MLILLFIFLQPRLSTLLFPFKRDQLLINFITTTKDAKAVNTKEFWKVREFYSPGHFVYDNKGIKNFPTSLLFLPDITNDSLFPFLIYTSPLTQSVDFLTTQKTIAPIVSKLSSENMNVIMQTDTLFLGQKDDAIFLVFLASQKDLIQTNGFLDYQTKDKELTKDKQWVSISRFDL